MYTRVCVRIYSMYILLKKQENLGICAYIHFNWKFCRRFVHWTWIFTYSSHNINEKDFLLMQDLCCTLKKISVQVKFMFGTSSRIQTCSIFHLKWKNNTILLRDLGKKSPFYFGKCKSIEIRKRTGLNLAGAPGQILESLYFHSNNFDDDSGEFPRSIAILVNLSFKEIFFGIV